MDPEQAPFAILHEVNIMVKIGEKIKSLRKQRDISQEVLADYLGVTFQAVSKWETDTAMPDVALIPAIASFFGVSTDELFDYNRLEAQRKVEAICAESWKYRSDDPARAEAVLRDGLKQFPGNDVLLNNLLVVIDTPQRAQEVIGLCRSLIESTGDDEVKYDALRILAGAYKSAGDYSRMKDTLERIPELYFSKLGVAAELLEGEERFEAAMGHRSVAFEDLLEMHVILAEHYSASGEKDKARTLLQTALALYRATEQDFSAGGFPSLHDAFADEAARIKEKLSAL